MKVYHLGPEIRGMILDIDNTLYRDTTYVRSQTELLLQRLAAHWDRPVDEVTREVERYRAEYASGRSGRRPSLGNSFAALGVDIPTSVQWRVELFRPEVFLRRDPRLVETLASLSECVALCAVTNNPSRIGRRTLEALGVDCIPWVVGLDTTLTSKPSPAPFEHALELMKLGAEVVVAVGDRHEIDVEVPCRMGMGGVVVESMEDVYGLPELILGRCPRHDTESMTADRRVADYHDNQQDSP